MSHGKKEKGISSSLVKTLVVSLLKATAALFAFVLKILSLIIGKISELFEKLSEHGSGH